MYKELELNLADGTSEKVAFKATGTTAYRFKQLTHKDLMTCIINMIDATKDAEDDTQVAIAIASSGNLDSISQLAYVMHRQAEAKSISDLDDLTFENYLDWLDLFDSMEFLYKAVQLINIYMNNTETTVEPKKEDAQPKEE